MTLSLLQIILMAGSMQGICLAILLYNRKNNRLANRILSFLMIILSFQIVLVSFDNREFFMTYPHLSKISWLLPSLFGPLIFLFTQKLTNENARLDWKDTIHLLPFLIYLILLSPYFFQSARAKRLYLDNFELASIDDFGLLNQFTNGIHLYYSLAALLLISRHQQNILQLFSEVRSKQLEWLKNFISLVLLIILFGIFVFYARKWDIPVLTKLYYYHYLGAVIIIYWIGYKALSQPQLFQNKIFAEKHELNSPGNLLLETEEFKDENPKEVKYRKSGLQDEEGEELLQKILDYMKTYKPFLQNEINLQELALEMGISKHFLSQVLNERLGQNFYTFINNYRVAEAKKLLVDPSMSNYNILVIAMEAGFNSKATFNSVFKKFSGMTPSSYALTHKVVV